MENDNNLIDISDLRTYFRTEEGIVKAVDGVSFNIKQGETLGIVGESGCGKSVTSLSIMQLVPQPRGRIESGKILFNENDGTSVDITQLKPHGEKIRRIRGNEIAMIFQEPMTSLNPVYTVGEQIMESVRLHQNLDNEAARERAIEMLELVGISAPRRRVDAYPHEFSGGMRQRAMIAMALSCNPCLLIADEPTTALDVTIEAQILELMKELQQKLKMSIMFITHDLEVIGEMSERVIVMYAGKVVERATVKDIFYDSKHPYTKGLLKSIPKIGTKKTLVPIKGSVPDLHSLPKGCHFAPRCPYEMDVCGKKEPPVSLVGPHHEAKCWLYETKEEVI